MVGGEKISLPELPAGAKIRLVNLSFDPGMTAIRRLGTAILVASALLSAPSPAAAQSRWDATSGLHPTQISVPWTLIDTAVADPSLAAGKLALATSSNAENMGYRLDPPLLAIPATTVFEFRGRLVSTASTDLSRTGMMVQINTAPFVVVQLGIASGQIFLNSADLVRGPVATVATTDAMHTYRIEVQGTTAGSPVKVYYDGALSLSGASYSNPSSLSTPVILWGEISNIARGTSEWEFVEHNATATPVPSMPLWGAALMLALLCPGGVEFLSRQLAAVRRRTRS